MIRIPYQRVLGVLGGLLLAAQVSFAAVPDTKAFNIFDCGKKVTEIVKQMNPDKHPMFIREFRGLASSHVGLSKCIGDELIGEGYTIQAGAMYELEGRLLRFPKDENEPFQGFTVRCTLTTDTGDAQNFSVDVINVDQGHLAVSETGEYAPPPHVPQGTKISHAPPSIVKTIMRPTPDSPYGVEILIETSPGHYAPVVPFDEGGLLKVKLEHGAVYAVKIYNDCPFEHVGSVYIDGLSRYSMADDPRFKDGLDLIPANGHRIIKGYYRDGMTIDSFQIGHYSECEAAKLLPSSPDIGLITVSFAACWQGNNVPPNEPAKEKGVAPAGTKRGPPRNDPTETVARTVGKLRALVKVRY